MKSNETKKLVLIPNVTGRTTETKQRMVIDISDFPNEKGAYVSRYESHEVPRFSAAQIY
ncbi:hypothetical protein VoSk93_08200 [Vibrio owensii]